MCSAREDERQPVVTDNDGSLFFFQFLAELAQNMISTFVLFLEEMCSISWNKLILFPPLLRSYFHDEFRNAYIIINWFTY